MKREFGFTQARFRSARHISLSCQREASKIPPDRSPAKLLMPPPIPPRAGERKGAVMLSVHLERDAQAQSAVEAELVSEHPLTFNTVTQNGEAGCQ